MIALPRRLEPACAPWHKWPAKQRLPERSCSAIARFALKAHLFADRYREYVKNAKNERLSELIAKTDG